MRCRARIRRENASVRNEIQSAKKPPRLRANHPHIRLGVVNVTYLERPVSVPGRSLIQFPIEGLKLICCSASLSLQRVFGPGTPMDGDRESLVTGHWDLSAITGQFERGPRRVHRFLLHRFIVFSDRFDHRGSRVAREFLRRIARIRSGQQAQVADTILMISRAVSGNPAA